MIFEPPVRSPLSRKRLINDLLQAMFEVAVGVGILLRHDEADDVVFGIGPVGGAEEAAPGEGAFAVDLAGGGKGAGDLEAETEVVKAIEEEGELAAGHHFDGAGRKDAGAIVGAAVEEGLQEDGIVPGGGGEAGATGKIAFVREGVVRIDCCAFCCPGDDVMDGVLGVYFCEAAGFCGGDVKAGVVHAEGIEEMLHEVILEIFSTDDFDQAAEEIDAEAVHPFLAGLVDEGKFCKSFHAFPKIVVEHAEPGGDTGLCVDGPAFLCADTGIVEAGGVGEQMAEGDGSPGGDRCIAAVGGIEFVEDLHVFEGWEKIADGLVEVELALFEELHNADADDGFCLAGDAKEIITAHGFASFFVGIAIAFVLDDVTVLYDEGDDAVDPAFIDIVIDKSVDAREAAEIDGRVGSDEERLGGGGRGCAGRLGAGELGEGEDGQEDQEKLFHVASL